METYDLKVCSSIKFNQGLYTLKNCSREIDSYLEKDFRKPYKVFAYDLVLENNVDATSYVDKLILSKEKCLQIRNEHSKYINENNFNVNLYFTMDPEIVFLRPKSLNTFVKYYRTAYKYYKNENYKQAFETFKFALTINPSDKRTKLLYKELELTLKELT
jgi:hypothetical protein